MGIRSLPCRFVSLIVVSSRISQTKGSSRSTVNVDFAVDAVTAGSCCRNEALEKERQTLQRKLKDSDAALKDLRMQLSATKEQMKDHNDQITVSGSVTCVYSNRCKIIQILLDCKWQGSGVANSSGSIESWTLVGNSEVRWRRKQTHVCAGRAAISEEFARWGEKSNGWGSY